MALIQQEVSKKYLCQWRACKSTAWDGASSFWQIRGWVRWKGCPVRTNWNSTWGTASYKVKELHKWLTFLKVLLSIPLPWRNPKRNLERDEVPRRLVPFCAKMLANGNSPPHHIQPSSWRHQIHFPPMYFRFSLWFCSPSKHWTQPSGT